MNASTELTLAPLALALARDINTIHAKAVAHADQAVEYAKAAGALLLQAKANLPHGQFLPWLATSCNVSERQAQRYMAAAHGRPLPVKAIKSDTMSYLPLPDEVADFPLQLGEAVFIHRTLADHWADEVFILPASKQSGLFHFAFLTGPSDSDSWGDYSKRPMTERAIRLALWLAMQGGWRDCTIERIEHPGFPRNPFNVPTPAPLRIALESFDQREKATRALTGAAAAIKKMARDASLRKGIDIARTRTKLQAALKVLDELEVAK